MLCEQPHSEHSYMMNMIKFRAFNIWYLQYKYDQKSKGSI